MSLARDWIGAALAADLTQNQLKAFLALFHQTLCYGKEADALTDKRLSKLAGVRIDRLKTAVDTLVEKGIIDVSEHCIFNAEYRIPEDLLYANGHAFFVPSLPKIGMDFRKTEEASENRVHTTNTFTANNLTPTTTKDSLSSIFEIEEELQYPETFGKPEKARAAIILDSLSPKVANDCLLLLNQAMQQGMVKAPHGYLYRLTEKARNGTLDTTGLRATTQATEQKTENNHRHQLKAIADEINGIDSLYKLAGITLDPITATNRANLVAKYNQLAGCHP